MEEDNALSTGMAAWCAGDRVGDPVSDLSLITERKSARHAVSRGLKKASLQYDAFFNSSFPEGFR